MLHSPDPDSTHAPAPVPLAVAGFQPGHVVQFYENDASLAGSIVDFTAAGLDAGQSAIVIATPHHREDVLAGLRARSLDVDGVLATGRLRMLDARETLTSVMAGRAPDPELFKRVLGEVFSSCEAIDDRRCVRAFGEMVDLLWRDGNSDGAIQLEKLWNDLAADHSFSLLCAYALGSFYRETDSSQFQAVCRQHDRVVPGESYAHASADARLREIALLQQRAQALEHELQYRRELEEALRQALARTETARAEAEQANRVKDDFLAILSHELRTPLNAILGWTQIMKSGSADAPTFARGLEVIARNAELQTRLIEDLLDVSRIIRGQLKINSDVVDLGATVTATAESVGPAVMAKGIDLQVRVEPSIVQVTGDAGRLHQIVWNLLSNAVKFTPANGSVTLVMERVGSEAQVVVSDTGQGIPPDFLPHVFDRFRQADNSTTRRYGGLGLGLAVVRQLVEAHGGTVLAESKGEGCGSTFTVKLPARTFSTQRGAPGQPVLVKSDASPKSRRV
jgi:signal transduction histidine kinase